MNLNGNKKQLTLNSQHSRMYHRCTKISTVLSSGHVFTEYYGNVVKGSLVNRI